MNRSLNALFVVMICSLCGSPLLADTYKCTDANGETQYTAVPPKGADCQSIKLNKSSAGNNSAAESAAPRALRDSAKATPPVATNDDIQRINQENCERAQSNLQLLSSSTRIRLKEGDEYRVIPEEERQEKMGLAQQQIDTYCK